MTKTLSLLYGSVAYTIFGGTFLYAIGFVGNVLVPKSIDSGEAGPLIPSLMINTALLSLFAVQHSGMARKGFKQWWTKIVPQPIERATYVLATNAALIALYTFWQPLPMVVWSVESPAGQALLQGLYLAGWVTVLASTIMIHHFDLFGMRQVWQHFQGKPYRHLGFRTPGLYAYLRHPIQVGFLIAFWVTPEMTAGHLMFSIVTTAYIVVAVKFWEERDLKREFGAKYEQYMDQVGGFIPKGRYQAPRPAEASTREISAVTAG